METTSHSNLDQVAIPYLFRNLDVAALKNGESHCEKARRENPISADEEDYDKKHENVSLEEDLQRGKGVGLAKRSNAVA